MATGTARKLGVALAVMAAAALLASCRDADPLPGSGTVDGIDLGLELGLDLTDLDAAPQQVSPDLLAAVVAKTGYDPPDPPTIYRAQTRLGDDEVALRIVVLPLPVGGRLAIAADTSGRVRASALFGTSTFETDTEGAWETFCYQFQNGPEALHLASTLDPAQVDEYWNTLQADPSPEAESTRALYRHRLLMSVSSQYVRATMRRTARGDLPPRDWIRQWRVNFVEISELSPLFARWIGDKAAERHHALALEAADRLDGVLAAAETEEPRDVRKMVSGEFYRDSCKACHAVKSDQLGGDEIYEGMRLRMEEFGVRRDILRVGWDLWGVPHEDDVSQAVANAFKAGFLFLGEIPAA